MGIARTKRLGRAAIVSISRRAAADYGTSTVFCLNNAAVLSIHFLK